MTQWEFAASVVTKLAFVLCDKDCYTPATPSAEDVHAPRCPRVAVVQDALAHYRPERLT